MTTKSEANATSPSDSRPSPPSALPTTPAAAVGLADAYAYGRVALGVTALVAPGPLGRGFGIGAGPQARLAARHIGARDLVAGLGMVLGRRHGRARGWYEAAAMIDVLDLAIVAWAARRRAMAPGRAVAVMALAGASAAAGMVLARQVDEAPPDSPAPPA